MAEKASSGSGLLEIHRPPRHTYGHTPLIKPGAKPEREKATINSPGREAAKGDSLGRS